MTVTLTVMEELRALLQSLNKTINFCKNQVKWTEPWPHTGTASRSIHCDNQRHTSNTQQCYQHNWDLLL